MKRFVAFIPLIAALAMASTPNVSRLRKQAVEAIRNFYPYQYKTGDGASFAISSNGVVTLHRMTAEDAIVILYADMLMQNNAVKDEDWTKPIAEIDYPKTYVCTHPGYHLETWYEPPPALHWQQWQTGYHRAPETVIHEPICVKD